MENTVYINYKGIWGMLQNKGDIYFKNYVKLKYVSCGLNTAIFIVAPYILIYVEFTHQQIHFY